MQNQKCYKCNVPLYKAYTLSHGNYYHKYCFKCIDCNLNITGEGTAKGNGYQCDKCSGNTTISRNSNNITVHGITPRENSRSTNGTLFFKSAGIANNKNEVEFESSTIISPKKTSFSRLTEELYTQDKGSNNMSRIQPLKTTPQLFKSTTPIQSTKEESITKNFNNLNLDENESSNNNLEIKNKDTESTHINKNTSTSIPISPKSSQESILENKNINKDTSINNVVNTAQVPTDSQPIEPQNAETIDPNKCYKCQKEFSLYQSKMKTSAGHQLHPECITCFSCNKAIEQGEYAMVDADFYHVDCVPEANAPKLNCEGCKEKITTSYLTHKDSPYHPECFKCLKCVKAIASNPFGEHKDIGPYCESCLVLLVKN